MDQVWIKFRKVEKGFLYVMYSLGYIPKNYSKQKKYFESIFSHTNIIIISIYIKYQYKMHTVIINKYITNQLFN